MIKTKLNVGSGIRPMATKENEWEDLDTRDLIPTPSHKDYRPDIVTSADDIPRKDDTYEKVYAHSILEHVRKGERLKFLGEWYRVLKQGGKVWISVPDMRLVAKMLVNSGLADSQNLINLIYGEQNYPDNVHKWGYTKESIKADLLSVGFKNIVFSPPDRYPCELIVEAIK